MSEHEPGPDGRTFFDQFNELRDRLVSQHKFPERIAEALLRKGFREILEQGQPHFSLSLPDGSFLVVSTAGNPHMEDALGLSGSADMPTPGYPPFRPLDSRLEPRTSSSRAIWN
jgi:hypothetical protein